MNRNLSNVLIIVKSIILVLAAPFLTIAALIAAVILGMLLGAIAGIAFLVLYLAVIAFIVLAVDEVFSWFTHRKTSRRMKLVLILEAWGLGIISLPVLFKDISVEIWRDRHEILAAMMGEKPQIAN